jgi:GT2 family glycosyltransferase
MSFLRVSIVAANSDKGVLKKAVETVKNTKIDLAVTIVDNGLDDDLKRLSAEWGCEYLRPHKNIGFGAAHNIAIRKYANTTPYFLVMNPDVEVLPGCIESLVELMEQNKNVVLATPKVLNPDGSLQKVHKRLPSFHILMGRRFYPHLLRRYFSNDLAQYELQDCDLDRPYFIPNVSGCFMFFRGKSLYDIGGFDERYFMYQEDVDISRRINNEGSIVYWPRAKITHLWARGSHKSLKLTVMNIVSVLRYFKKWGLNNSCEVREYNEHYS